MKNIAIGRAVTFNLLNGNGDLVIESAIEASEIERFARGGLVLDGHTDKADAIIGNVTKAWNDGDGLMVEIEFNERSQGRRASARVEAARKDGTYPGLSLRYSVELKELTHYGKILRSVRLLELSLVDSPADCHACIHEFRQVMTLAEIDRRESESNLKFRRALEANIRKLATPSSTARVRPAGIEEKEYTASRFRMT